MPFLKYFMYPHPSFILNFGIFCGWKLMIKLFKTETGGRTPAVRNKGLTQSLLKIYLNVWNMSEVSVFIITIIHLVLETVTFILWLEYSRYSPVNRKMDFFEETEKITGVNKFLTHSVSMKFALSPVFQNQVFGATLIAGRFEPPNHF